MNRILKSFRFWTGAFVLSGYFALAITEGFRPQLLLVGMFAAIFGDMIGRRVRGVKWYEILWNMASICYIPYLMVDLVFLSDIVVAMAHLVIFVQIAKCLNPKNRADYLQMYVLSFMMLMASAALYKDALFALALICCLVTALRGIMLFHIACEVRLFDPAGRPAPLPDEISIPPGWKSRFSSVAVVFAVAIVFGSAVLFCIVPRVEVGFLSRPASADAEIGFDEEIDLSTYEDLHDSGTIAFTARLPDHPNGFSDGPLLWKGIALDLYNGEKWSQIRCWSNGALRRRRRISPDSNGRYIIRQNDAANYVRQHINIDFVQSRVLFGMATVDRIDIQNDAGVSWDEWDGSWRMANEKNRSISVEYTAFSSISRPTPDELREAPSTYNDFFRQVYIENGPWRRDRYDSRRIDEFAQQVVGDAETAYDKTIAIRDFLKTDYDYLLNVDKSSDEMPLEDFLFHTKMGHCQYFGTALAMMARGVGVPARAVTGYRGGEWDEVTKRYIVRDVDAHVWVEVYFPGYGWVPFDASPPSPGVARIPLMKRFLATTARQQLLLQMQWVRYVLGYNSNAQKDLIGDLGHRAGTWREGVVGALQEMSARNSKWRNAWRRLAHSYWLVSIFAVTLVVLLIVNFVNARRELIREAGTGRRKIAALTYRQRKAMLIYAKMLSLLKYRRLAKPPAITPAEFSRNVARKWPDGAECVDQITEIYYLLRYAKTENEYQLVADGKQLLKNLHRQAQPNLLTRRISSW